MAALDIFVSFEFDKDRDLKNNFYEQARTQPQYRVRNCSLNESYPDEQWRRKAKEAIRGCDVVIVLIGQDTHNSQGVIVETDIARSLGKPVIQVRPRRRRYQGVPRLGEPITWRWTHINDKLAELFPGR